MECMFRILPPPHSRLCRLEYPFLVSIMLDIAASACKNRLVLRLYLGQKYLDTASRILPPAWCGTCVRWPYGEGVF